MESNKSQREISYIRFVTEHRIELVKRIKNIDWILDSLIQNKQFTVEDKELVECNLTPCAKVRRLLDIVHSKGEEASKCLVHVLFQGCTTNTDLQSWFNEICFQPSVHVLSKLVIVSCPVDQYKEKLRCKLLEDSKYMTSYPLREEILLDENFTDTVLEASTEYNQHQCNVSNLMELFTEEGTLNTAGEIILITGDAGIGKSVLLQKLQNMWATEQLCTDIKFFFQFRCRMFSFFQIENHGSLKDLLFRYNCHPDKDVEGVYQYIIQNPSTVMFSFDGFDELVLDFHTGNIPNIVCPYQEAQPLCLLINLLQGHLLKGSKKILSTRTGTEVPRRFIKKSFTLKGFSQEKLLKYLQKSFKDKHTQTLIQSQLEANPHLYSLCSIPLFCWIIFKCYEQFYSTTDTYGLPGHQITLTDIYLLMVEVFINRCLLMESKHRMTRSQVETFLAKKEVLLNFGRLALLGMQRASFVFSHDEIVSANISEADLQLGFLRPVKRYSGCGGQATYEFLHLTIQSFFAALFLILDNGVNSDDFIFFLHKEKYSVRFEKICLCHGSASEITEVKCKTANEYFNFTALFVSGLLSKKNLLLLKQLTSPKSLKKKNTILFSHLTEHIHVHLKSLPRSRIGEDVKVQALPQFVWLMKCVYETQSIKVAQLAASQIRANFLKLTYCNIHSADCSALSAVLRLMQRPLSIELDNNNINDHGVKELQPILGKLKTLRLSVNQITDTGVTILVQELIKYRIIQKLGLYRNQITDTGAKDLAIMIECCPDFTSLWFGKNMLTSDGGIALGKAIQKSHAILFVGMWGNEIRDAGVISFAKALKNHPSLQTLSLAATGTSSEGGVQLAEALCQNTSLKTLWLIQNDLGDEAAASFAEMLKVNKTLEILWLTENKITIKGATQLSHALLENTTLKEICLRDNKISTEEAQVFKDVKRILF
ncbi:nucleotide-binding oligomerization domain-containing protein 1-like [Protopterus annectens]|uniref:nucleotide-binding oligomerization domain-containing protein 1-like n=1 Tax=Protopterus annectens TaxID=7888 RepID=UPI001CF9993C|nr:nucleotide-binding oligomerization domain-containing protein 1-like [Protopterus annectens]